MDALAGTVIFKSDRSGFTAHGYAQKIYATREGWSADKANAERYTQESAERAIRVMRANNGISIVLYGTEPAPAGKPLPPGVVAGEPVNSQGSYYAADGTFMNADGTRSIFCDVDQ